jgi:hypothetical protein
VHAPHSPSPHPSLVPVSAQSSRSTSSSRFIGCVRTFSRFVFNTKDTKDTEVKPVLGLSLVSLVPFVLIQRG